MSDSTFNSITGTSFVAVSDLMTVGTGSAGQIQFSANLSIASNADFPTISSPESNIEMKWQYRTVGGTFADVTTAVNSDPDVNVTYVSRLDKYFVSNGSVNCSPIKSGLSASTDYEVQLFARRTSVSTAKTMFFIGTASAVGS